MLQVYVANVTEPSIELTVIPSWVSAIGDFISKRRRDLLQRGKEILFLLH
jgi:hypothetical protein